MFLFQMHEANLYRSLECQQWKLRKTRSTISMSSSKMSWKLLESTICSSYVVNPTVGASNLNRVGIMGAHETGNISHNDGKLIEFCEMNHFLITVTIFRHKEMHKTKWTTPYGRYHNQIDHFLIDKFFRKSISFCDTRVLWGVYGCL